MKRFFLVFVIMSFSIMVIHAQFNTHSKLVGASSSLDFGLFSQKDGLAPY